MNLAKREKFIKFVIWIIVVAFVTTIFATWGAHNYYERQQNPVAMKVDGEEISRQEFFRLYDRKVDELKKYYDDELSDSIILEIRNSVADELIQRTLFMKLAKKYRLQSTPRDIQGAVARLFMDNNNQFNSAAFEQYKRDQSAAWWERLENSVKDDIVLNKAHSLLTDKVKITDDEAQFYFAASNMQANAEQIYLNPSLLIDSSAVQNYYRENIDIFIKPEKRWIKHITLNDTNIANDTPGSASRVKIRNIHDKIMTGEIFDELAAVWSDEPFKYRDGKLYRNGDLGYLTKSDLMNDDDYTERFIQTAFTLKNGEISEPFRSENGWHIVKVENIADTDYFTVDEKAEMIRWRLTSDTEVEKTRELAQKIKEEIDGNQLTFEQAVKKYSNGKSIKKNGALGWLPRTEIPHTLWDDTQYENMVYELPVERNYLDRAFSDSIFLLAPNEISSPVSSNLGYHIVRVTEYKVPDNTDFKAEYPQTYRALIGMKARMIIEDWYQQEKKKTKIVYSFGQDDFLTRVEKRTED